MRSTTQSKLAEQAFADYQKETVPTDAKRGLAYAFNEYASKLGLPFTLSATAPSRLAKIGVAALRSLQGMRVPKASNRSLPIDGQISVRWLCSQISEAWGL